MPPKCPNAFARCFRRRWLLANSQGSARLQLHQIVQYSVRNAEQFGISLINIFSPKEPRFQRPIALLGNGRMEIAQQLACAPEFQKQGLTEHTIAGRKEKLKLFGGALMRLTGGGWGQQQRGIGEWAARWSGNGQPFAGRLNQRSIGRIGAA